MKKETPAERQLFEALATAGYQPAKQHQFLGGLRDWRFDLAYPPILLAIEIDGLHGHIRHQDRVNDFQKRNAAIECGWRVLVYPAGRIATLKRRALIVEQVARIICGVCDELSAVEVLADTPDRKLSKGLG